MKAVRLLLYCAIAVPGIYYIYSKTNIASGALQFSYVMDTKLSELAQQALIAWCKATITPETDHAVLATVSTMLPFTKTVTRSKIHGAHYQITVVAQQPVAQLNEVQLLCDNGTVCNQIDYQPSSYKFLPHICIESDNQSAQLRSCANWLTNQEHGLFATYQVTWQAAQLITFFDATTRIKIIGSATALPTKLLTDHIAKIVTDLGPTKKSRLVDIRFKDQIILQTI